MRWGGICGIAAVLCGCQPEWQYEARDGNLVIVDDRGRIIDHNPTRDEGAVLVVPIVDEGAPGFDSEQYDKDLRECRDYAGRVQDRTVSGALAGAAIGAGIGAAAGSSVNATGSLAASGAGMGVITGGASGSAATGGGQAAVLLRCLDGRGYHVLGAE